MAYDHAVHVRLEGRHFVVQYDADGEVLRIKQRKKLHPNTRYERIAEVQWWSARSHGLGNGNTMAKRVIEMARQQKVGVL